MPLEDQRQELLAKLRSVGQDHALRFWSQFDEATRAQLVTQLEAIDFEQLGRLFHGAEVLDDWGALASRAEPPAAIRLDGRGNRFTAAEAREKGAEALADGKLGAVLVAGGQGTRLGFDHPKGMYAIGPVSQASLFQILFEKLQAMSRRYNVRIPLYLMTSPATHDETAAYLASKHNFGLRADDVHLFCQGTMPAVDAVTGRVLLAEPGRLFASPDGHGGMLAALDRSGGLRDIRLRGIEDLFYFQVDNPLAQVCDPEFIGYHLLSLSELSTQVVAKQLPAEKVGNVVTVDGRMRIIEYSDLPASAGERRNAQGGLALWAGNTAIHVIDVAFLERVKNDEHRLPFHRAHKAVPYVDETGKLVEPAQPNAIKFERFIFDLLPAAERAIVVEVEPGRAFAPVKNAPGSKVDSPELVQKQMLAQAREWLTTAGAQVAEATPVEISPLFAMDAEELKKKLVPGRRFDQATYLR
ncbi:MAG: UDPGP type 1 family protein [Planctomycetes bacterium]|nr:UDPGP type 1 family protein [Planctomycetota bacterium]